jgi:hypothetical protein
MAAPTAILGIVAATVLFGKHVLDMESGRRRGEIGKVAILPTTTGALANKLAKGPFRHAWAERSRSARALACRIAMKSMVWT